MSQLSRCSYAAPTPPIKSHTTHLNCVTPLCIYFNWVAARLQRSPRLPRPYSTDTSGARCFLCFSFSPKSAAAASLLLNVHFFRPHPPLSSQETDFLCGRSYQSFKLFVWHSLRLLSHYVSIEHRIFLGPFVFVSVDFKFRRKILKCKFIFYFSCFPKTSCSCKSSSFLCYFFICYMFFLLFFVL